MSHMYWRENASLWYEFKHNSFNAFNNDLYTGDLLFINWQNDNIWDHVYIITGWDYINNNWEPRLSAHSNNRQNITYRQFLNMLINLVFQMKLLISKVYISIIMFGKQKVLLSCLFLIIFSLINLFIYQIWKFSFYRQFSTEKKARNWVIDNIKLKNKNKLKSSYCIEQTMGNSTIDSSFEVFWGEINKENWDQININDSLEKSNYNFKIGNIKNEKGQNGNRFFVTQNRFINKDSFLQTEYFCFEPNEFVTSTDNLEFKN
jgi:hypothetical protein